MASKAVLKETKQARSAATRERLLEAAVATLAKRGYSDTTTTTIAEEAGVTRGALQHHFASRELLLDCAMDYLNEKRCEKVQEILSVDRQSMSTADVLDVIRLHAFGDFFQATLVFFIGIRNDPDYMEKIRIYDSKVSDKIGEVLDWYFGEAFSRDAEGRNLIVGAMNLIRGIALMKYLMPSRSLRSESLMGPDVSGRLWNFWKDRIAADIDQCLARLRGGRKA